MNKVSRYVRVKPRRPGAGTETLTPRQGLSGTERGVEVVHGLVEPGVVRSGAGADGMVRLPLLEEAPGAGHGAELPGHGQRLQPELLAHRRALVEGDVDARLERVAGGGVEPQRRRDRLQEAGDPSLRPGVDHDGGQRAGEARALELGAEPAGNILTEGDGVGHGRKCAPTPLAPVVSTLLTAVRRRARHRDVGALVAARVDARLVLHDGAGGAAAARR